MKKNIFTFIVLPAMLMMGCSTQYEYSHKSSYVNQPHLQIAPGLSGAKLMQDYYPIPACAEGEVDRQPAALIPPGSHIGEIKRGGRRAK